MQHGRVEAERHAGHQRAAFTLRTSNGCNGCSTTMRDAPSRRRHVQRIEQFGQRDGGWSALTRVLVGAGVGDDQLARWPRRPRRAAAAGPQNGCRARPSSGRGPARRRRRRHRVAGKRRRRARPGRPPDEAPSASAPSCRRSACRCGSWRGWAVRRDGLAAVRRRRVAAARCRPAAPAVRDDVGELALHLAWSARRRRRRCASAVAMPSVSAASQSRSGRCPVSESTDPLQSVDVFGEPAGQLDPVAADVVERQRRVDPGLRSRRTWRPRPGCGRGRIAMCCARSRRRTACGVPDRSPTGCSPAGPSRVMFSRSSSLKPNRARTGADWARLSTSLAVTLLPASASSCDATPSSGLVCSSERSASRTRSRCAGCTPRTTSPRPKSATIKGAYVSMSGHITRMSRGSSVGSSASRPSSTSRSTSIWRAGPWQLCTCTDRSSAASVRPSRPDGVGGQVGLQPARAGCPGRSAATEQLRRSRARRAGFVAARAGPDPASPAADGGPRGGWCPRAAALFH